MLSKFVSLSTVGVMVSVLALYELGQIPLGDAFFIAVAILAVFTGQQLIVREDMGFRQAVASLTRPQSWRNRTSFAAYLACLALGLLVTVQALAVA